MDEIEKLPPTVALEGDAPVRKVKPEELRNLGQHLSKIFEQFESDRKLSELKWMKNLRQYLGIYDPDILEKLDTNRSKAYPRLTRVKCISVLSRLMNLMFPGNERNWQLKASPSAELPPDEVLQELQRIMERDRKEGAPPGPLTDERLQAAIQNLADDRAETLSRLIDDQMQELGGDQTADYIRINRKVLDSGIKYGIGYLRGPHVRRVERTSWQIVDGQPQPVQTTVYKPQYEFLNVWDVYLDMSAKVAEQSEGYFIRLVMSKSQLRKLGEREDFFKPMIKQVIKEHPRGNYKPKGFETELRDLGVRQATLVEPKEVTGKYELIIWHGPISGQMLIEAGAEVAEDKKYDDLNSEIWMCGNHVIKADLDPWTSIGAEMKRLHTFVFDEDDTSPVGNGVPNVVRDSQMAVCAATRMLLDNASVVCGPNIEVNVDLLEPSSDVSTITSHRIWERISNGVNDSAPAVRNIPIDGHIPELTNIVKLFMEFADTETFVNPATGGDMERGYSEPMRTAAGASMMRGDAALPFKDIVRNFDAFTQSLIQSLVVFNKQFNPQLAPEGDYNVIARGATSLIAKEIRGMQVDQLAQTLTPEERMHIDERKFVETRFKVRDLDDLLVAPDEALRRQDAQRAELKEARELQRETAQAEVRKVLSDAFKNIAQGQKNSANADATAAQTVLNALKAGVEMDVRERESYANVATQINAIEPPARSEQAGQPGGAGRQGAA